MPEADQNAQLTPQQLGELAIKALNEKGLQNCPRCQHLSGWTAEVLGVLVTPLPAVALSVPPLALPCAVLTCKHCAFTSMHNLKLLGVMP
jgi:hypothetical protein